MTQNPDRIAWDLGLLERGRGELPGALAALLFRFDPIQIAYQTNADEYQPEASHILTRLSLCHNVGDVCQVVYEELVRSFGAEAVGSTEDYEAIARETWALWQRFEGAS